MQNMVVVGAAKLLIPTYLVLSTIVQQKGNWSTYYYNQAWVGSMLKGCEHTKKNNKKKKQKKNRWTDSTHTVILEYFNIKIWAHFNFAFQHC